MTLPFPHVVAETEKEAVETAMALNGLKWHENVTRIKVRRTPQCFGVWLVEAEFSPVRDIHGNVCCNSAGEPFRVAKNAD